MYEEGSRRELLEDQVKDLQFQNSDLQLKLKRINREWKDQVAIWTNKEILWAKERYALEERLSNRNRRGVFSRKAKDSEGRDIREGPETEEELVSRLKQVVDQQKFTDMEQLSTGLRQVFLTVTQLEAEKASLRVENNKLSHKDHHTSLYLQQMEPTMNMNKQEIERLKAKVRNYMNEVNFLTERLLEEKGYKAEAHTALRERIFHEAECVEKFMNERENAWKEKMDLLEQVWTRRLEETVEEDRKKMNKLLEEKEALNGKLQSAQHKIIDMEEKIKPQMRFKNDGFRQSLLYLPRAKAVTSEGEKDLREQMNMIENFLRQRVEQFTEIKDLQYQNKNLLYQIHDLHKQLDGHKREWREQERIWAKERKNLEERLIRKTVKDRYREASPRYRSAETRH